MTNQQGTELVLKCRYRYATGCDWEGRSLPSRHQHEKTASVHAGHRIELTTCPVCGDGFSNESFRSQHLTTEHGIKASTGQRQELDARQAAELYAALYSPSVPAGSPAPVLSPAAWAPSANGHAPDPAPATLDLLAAQEAFAALVAEVEQLRAENAALRTEAAVLRQVRAALAE